MHWFDGASPALLWGILAIVLAIAEMVIPGTFLIWISLAAALTAGVTLLLPVDPSFQMLAFAILSALSVSGGRLWYLARPVEAEDPLLNDRAARMIGRKVEVIEAIVKGEGRVRVDDGSWRANGPDAEVGAHMLVTGVSGSTLTVTHLPPEPA
ncbi:NfeD family protein [Sphingobium nicotianae]|uniref:NfeD family protein n=1 Tax=Sphingobium nicotianae TaxID=2782607 RepID=A0A9X1ITG5_9SPHN|nr:NfeD family protein [Sphingobium nicotianae]MBT2189330.1 NfeD family protein [Sphingobium nicotianae]